MGYRWVIFWTVVCALSAVNIPFALWHGDNDRLAVCVMLFFSSLIGLSVSINRAAWDLF